MDNVGLNIRKRRTDINISQKELAEKTGLSNDYISKLELGKKDNPSLEVMQKIATALYCSVDELTNKQEITEPSVKDVVNELIRTKQANSNEATNAGLILEKLREENLIDENFTFTPKIKDLLEEAIKLDAKLNNMKKSRE